MQTLLIALFAGAVIGLLIKISVFFLLSRERQLPSRESIPMRTSLRVLVAVAITAASSGVGALLGVTYGIFHLVVVEGGLGAGGHAINSSLDGTTVLYAGMAIGAALGIGAALYFWQLSKPG